MDIRKQDPSWTEIVYIPTLVQKRVNLSVHEEMRHAPARSAKQRHGRRAGESALIQDPIEMQVTVQIDSLDRSPLNSQFAVIVPCAGLRGGFDFFLQLGWQIGQIGRDSRRNPETGHCDRPEHPDDIGPQAALLRVTPDHQLHPSYR